MSIFGFQYATASRGNDDAVEVFTKNLRLGYECSMVLPVSQSRVQAYLSGNDDRLIQHQFPELNATQREFLMSGMDEAKQIEFYGPNEDENVAEDLAHFDQLVGEARI